MLNAGSWAEPRKKIFAFKNLFFRLRATRSRVAPRVVTNDASKRGTPDTATCWRCSFALAPQVPPLITLPTLNREPYDTLVYCPPLITPAVQRVGARTRPSTSRLAAAWPRRVSFRTACRVPARRTHTVATRARGGGLGGALSLFTSAGDLTPARAQRRCMPNSHPRARTTQVHAKLEWAKC